MNWEDWQRIDQERLRREDELVRLAEQLARMLSHELAELEDSEADFVRQCIAEIGW